MTVFYCPICGKPFKRIDKECVSTRIGYFFAGLYYGDFCSNACHDEYYNGPSIVHDIAFEKGRSQLSYLVGTIPNDFKKSKDAMIFKSLGTTPYD
jgi:hypothetical protein